VLKKRNLLVVMCCLLFALAGCAIKEIQKQTQIVENLGFIKGNVTRASNQQGPVIVVRYRDRNDGPIREGQVFASRKGDFMFPVIPGSHYIAAFIDINNDGDYQPEEPGNYHGIPSSIDVGPKQTVTLETIIITGPLPEQVAEFNSNSKIRAAWENIGRVTTLDDRRFTRKNYSLGLWRPFDFLETAEGGLFFLNEFQQGKVPVLFIHGMLGGPTDWQPVIEGLDKDRFQPWVLFYPSGLRLDIISDYLVEAVSRLQNRYAFNEFYVIAHSMGGLITRSFVKKYVEHDPEKSKILKLVMTVNSPMAGMSEASLGVEHSPIVVPSWRDLETGSEFLHGIHSWNWPGEIPYYLVISYANGESGDGVVPLESQVTLKLQDEATRMHIFNNKHVGTLNDIHFIALFNRILNENN